MMKEAVAREMNSQINRELFSAYLYLSMAAWFEGRGLSGFSNWMRVQAQEERDHAMGFFTHMLERGAAVTLEAIEKPDVEWASPLAAFEAVLTHERYITGSIDNLLETAQNERDHASANFMQWYVAEQVEEEANAEALIQQLHLVDKSGGGGIFMMDRELSARVYIPASIIAGK